MLHCARLFFAGRGVKIITQNNRLTRETGAIGIAGLLLFTLNIWQQPFINFESRFAVFIQEMLRHGPSLFPTAYGEPYPDYPATATLFSYAIALLFGGVNKLAAVLPTALASALTLAFSYRLLAPLSRSWALLAVCMQLLTATFVAEARSISLDQMLATITVASFFCAYSADAERQPLRRRWLPLLLIAGFAIRGPLGLVLPAGVVCSYYLLSQQWRSLLRFGLIAALLLIGCWGFILALAQQAGGADFVHEVVRMQVSGRMESRGSAKPLYYFTSSFGNYALAFPLAFLVILATAARLRAQFSAAPVAQSAPSAARLLLFLLGWTLLILIGLSIPHTKKIRYLLPMMPAIAAIATYPFIDQSNRLLRWLRKIIDTIFLLLPALAIAGLWAGKNFVHKRHLELPLSLWLIIAILLALQFAVIACTIKLRADARSATNASLAAITLLTLQILLIEPVQLQLHDTRAFVRAVEQLRAQQPAPLAFFKVGKDAAAIKYLVNVDYDLRPNFYSEPEQVEQAARPFYLVLDSAQRTALTHSKIGKLTPIASGRFDNDTYIALYVDKETVDEH